MSRSRNEILQLRDSLDKAAVENSNSVEAIIDILQVLRGITVTADIIKTTKIGLSVNSIRKKYSAIIQNWKSLYQSSQSNSEKGNVESSQLVPPPAPKPAVPDRTQVVKTNSTASDDLHELVASYADGRKKIVTLFVNCFDSGVDRGIAQAIGYGLESTINALHPFETDLKGYQNKARKLHFNLKKNEDLRRSVLNGSLSVQSLVHMPTSALATPSLAESRNKASAEAHDACCSDWESRHRDEILEQNGLDPSRGTEFKCHKCKQSKTTMYPVQTRSADEPMTLFVTCLNCGFHWKTQ